MTLDRITYDPAILNGKACIQGMRISVSQILRLLAGGMTPQEILDDYPSIEDEDIRQCLAYAAGLASGQAT